MKPNCNQCSHYFVTFNKDTPRGCRAYGIQTASIPSMVVRKANNGSDCLGFTPKKAKKKEKDLNDPKYWQA